MNMAENSVDYIIKLVADDSELKKKLSSGDFLDKKEISKIKTLLMSTMDSATRDAKNLGKSLQAGLDVDTAQLEKTLKFISGVFNELEKKINDEKIDNIEFLGFKSGNSLYDIVANAKFVCVPSEWYENNPMTIIESYTLGTPVIGASIGGITEIISENKTGFLFESSSIKSLCDAIQKAESLSHNEYLNMVDYTKEYAKNAFSQSVHLKHLKNVYQQTIKNY